MKPLSADEEVDRAEEAFQARERMIEVCIYVD
jgi:hypothetical protein